MSTNIMNMKELEALSIQLEMAEKIKFEIYYGLRKDENETEEEYLTIRNGRIVQEFKLYERLAGFNRAATVNRLANKFSLDVVEIEKVAG